MAVSGHSPHTCGPVVGAGVVTVVGAGVVVGVTVVGVGVVAAKVVPGGEQSSAIGC